jgi:hypothetical protein
LHIDDGAKAFLAAIPDGPEGITLTLAIMARIVRAYRKHPGIIALATELTSHLPDKAFAQEAEALHEFVRDQVRYIRDVRDVETVRTPDRLSLPLLRRRLRWRAARARLAGSAPWRFLGCGRSHRAGTARATSAANH